MGNIKSEANSSKANAVVLQVLHLDNTKVEQPTPREHTLTRFEHPTGEIYAVDLTPKKSVSGTSNLGLKLGTGTLPQSPGLMIPPTPETLEAFAQHSVLLQQDIGAYAGKTHRDILQLTQIVDEAIEKAQHEAKEKPDPILASLGIMAIPDQKVEHLRKQYRGAVLRALQLRKNSKLAETLKRYIEHGVALYGSDFGKQPPMIGMVDELLHVDKALSELVLKGSQIVSISEAKAIRDQTLFQDKEKIYEAMQQQNKLWDENHEGFMTAVLQEGSGLFFNIGNSFHNWKSYLLGGKTATHLVEQYDGQILPIIHQIARLQEAYHQAPTQQEAIKHYEAFLEQTQHLEKKYKAWQSDIQNLHGQSKAWENTYTSALFYTTGGLLGGIKGIVGSMAVGKGFTEIVDDITAGREIDWGHAASKTGKGAYEGTVMTAFGALGKVAGSVLYKSLGPLRFTLLANEKTLEGLIAAEEITVGKFAAGTAEALVGGGGTGVTLGFSRDLSHGVPLTEAAVNVPKNFLWSVVLSGAFKSAQVGYNRLSASALVNKPVSDLLKRPPKTGDDDLFPGSPIQNPGNSNIPPSIQALLRKPLPAGSRTELDVIGTNPVKTTHTPEFSTQELVPAGAGPSWGPSPSGALRAPITPHLRALVRRQTLGNQVEPEAEPLITIPQPRLVPEEMPLLHPLRQGLKQPLGNPGTSQPGIMPFVASLLPDERTPFGFDFNPSNRPGQIAPSHPFQGLTQTTPQDWQPWGELIRQAEQEHQTEEERDEVRQALEKEWESFANGKGGFAGVDLEQAIDEELEKRDKKANELPSQNAPFIGQPAKTGDLHASLGPDASEDITRELLQLEEQLPAVTEKERIIDQKKELLGLLTTFVPPSPRQYELINKQLQHLTLKNGDTSAAKLFLLLASCLPESQIERLAETFKSEPLKFSRVMDLIPMVQNDPLRAQLLERYKDQPYQSLYSLSDSTTKVEEGLHYKLDHSDSPEKRHQLKIEHANETVCSLNFMGLWRQHISSCSPETQQKILNMIVPTPTRQGTFREMIDAYTALENSLTGADTQNPASGVIKSAISNFLQRNQYQFLSLIAQNGMNSQTHTVVENELFNYFSRSLSSRLEDEKESLEQTKAKIKGYLDSHPMPLTERAQLCLLIRDIYELGAQGSITYSDETQKEDLNSVYLDKVLDENHSPAQLIKMLAQHYLKHLAQKTTGPQTFSETNLVALAMEYGQKVRYLDFNSYRDVYGNMLKNHPQATLKDFLDIIVPRYQGYNYRVSKCPDDIRSKLRDTFSNDSQGLDFLLEHLGFDNIYQAASDHSKDALSSFTRRIKDELSSNNARHIFQQAIHPENGLSSEAEKLNAIYNGLVTSHPELPERTIPNNIAVNLHLAIKAAQDMDLPKAKLLLEILFELQKDNSIPIKENQLEDPLYIPPKENPNCTDVATVPLKKLIQDELTTSSERNLLKTVVLFQLIGKAIKQKDFPYFQEDFNRKFELIHDFFQRTNSQPSTLDDLLNQFQSHKIKQFERQDKNIEEKLATISPLAQDKALEDKCNAEFEQNRKNLENWQNYLQSRERLDVGLALAFLGPSALQIKSDQGVNGFRQFIQQTMMVLSNEDLRASFETWKNQSIPKSDAVKKSIMESKHLTDEQKQRSLEPDNANPQQLYQMVELLSYIAKFNQATSNPKSPLLIEQTRSILGQSKSFKESLDAMSQLIFNHIITRNGFEPLGKHHPRALDDVLNIIEDKTGLYGRLNSGLLKVDSGAKKPEDALKLYGKTLPQVAEAEAYIRKILPSLNSKYDMAIRRFVEHFGTDIIKTQADRGKEKLEKLLELFNTVYNGPAKLRNEVTRTIKQSKLKQNETLRLLELTEGLIQNRAQDKLLSELSQASDDKPIDLTKLGKTLLEAFAEQNQLNCTVTDENAKTWDVAAIAKVSAALKSWEEPHKARLAKLVEDTLNGKFEANLLDPNTDMGKVNLRTKALFEAAGLNFKTWLNYTQRERFTTGVSSDKNPESLIEGGLKEFSEHFPAVFKLLPQVKQDEIITHLKQAGYEYDVAQGKLVPLSDEKYSSQELAKVMKHLNAYLDKHKLWEEMAKTYPNEKDRIDEVKHHITGLTRHFEQIETLLNDTQSKTFSIGMWNRNPAQDLTIGDKVRCCISLDNNNARAILDYLQSTATQFIEVKEPKTGKTASISLLYWVTNEKGQLECIVDIIQANKDYSDSDREAIRDKTLAYAKKLAQEVAGKEVPVRLGKHYHTVKVEGQEIDETVAFLGDFTDPKIFFNALGGWKDVKAKHKGTFIVVP